MERNRRAAVEATFECPKKSSVVLKPWGKVGHARLCVANGVEHGAWAAWENTSQLRGSAGCFNEHPSCASGPRWRLAQFRQSRCTQPSRSTVSSSPSHVAGCEFGVVPTSPERTRVIAYLKYSCSDSVSRNPISPAVTQ